MAIPYQKVMVTLDGSDVALQALPQAELIAATFNCKLILFRVIRSEERKTALVMSEDDQKHVEEGIAQHRSQHISDTEETLHNIVATLDLPAEQCEVAVGVGEAAEEIIHYAVAQDIDLIIICTHGRSGVRRLMRGSVAEKILHDSSRPVLLVRAQ